MNTELKRHMYTDDGKPQGQVVFITDEVLTELQETAIQTELKEVREKIRLILKS